MYGSKLYFIRIQVSCLSHVRINFLVFCVSILKFLGWEECLLNDTNFLCFRVTTNRLYTLCVPKASCSWGCSSRSVYELPRACVSKWSRGPTFPMNTLMPYFSVAQQPGSQENRLFCAQEDKKSEDTSLKSGKNKNYKKVVLLNLCIFNDYKIVEQ